MRKIKFRGRAQYFKPVGEMVYGYLTYDDEKEVYWIDGTPVFPESIQQFCGYDSEGNEIYEGDEVVADGETYKVELKPEYGFYGDLKYCKKK